MGAGSEVAYLPARTPQGKGFASLIALRRLAHRLVVLGVVLGIAPGDRPEHELDARRRELEHPSEDVRPDDLLLSLGNLDLVDQAAVLAPHVHVIADLLDQRARRRVLAQHHGAEAADTGVAGD